MPLKPWRWAQESNSRLEAGEMRACPGQVASGPLPGSAAAATRRLKGLLRAAATSGIKKHGHVHALSTGDACQERIHHGAHVSCKPASRIRALVGDTGPAQRQALDPHLSAIQLHGSFLAPLDCCTIVPACPPGGQQHALCVRWKLGLVLCTQDGCSSSSRAAGIGSQPCCCCG